MIVMKLKLSKYLTTWEFMCLELEAEQKHIIKKATNTMYDFLYNTLWV